MALSKAQEIALFQILQVPYNAQTQQLSSDGQMSVQKIVPTAIACYNTIKTYLTDYIYTDADITLALSTLLDEWICLGTRTESMVGGAIGSIQGLEYSVPKQRAEITRQVIIIVPYYRVQDDYVRQSAGAGQVSIVR
jgi:hypothetical protein